jgi:hypothetical protein
MTGKALRRVALVAPVLVALLLGLAGCGEERRGDRRPERREGVDIHVHTGR